MALGASGAGAGTAEESSCTRRVARKSSPAVHECTRDGVGARVFLRIACLLEDSEARRSCLCDTLSWFVVLGLGGYIRAGVVVRATCSEWCAPATSIGGGTSQSYGRRLSEGERRNGDRREFTRCPRCIQSLRETPAAARESRREWVGSSST